MHLRRRGHRVLPSAAGALGVLALMVTTLVGCSGDDSTSASDDPSSSSTSSSSATPSPTELLSSSPSASPEPKKPQAPPAKDSATGRKDFAEFVVASWSYALRTNDAAAVTGLSPKGKPCQGCKPFADELAKRRKQKWYVDFPGAKVRKVALAPGGDKGTYVAKATVDIPASRSYFKDGTFRNDSDAHKGATFEVTMKKEKQGFVLLGFQLS